MHLRFYLDVIGSILFLLSNSINNYNGDNHINSITIAITVTVAGTTTSTTIVEVMIIHK